MSSSLPVEPHDDAKTADAASGKSSLVPAAKDARAGSSAALSSTSNKTNTASSEKTKKGPSLLNFHSSKSIRTGTEVVKSLKWVIFPDNKYIKIWDLIVLIALFLLAFMLPYQIGVSGGSPLLIHIPWLAINIFINSIFFVDTFLYFFRAYYTKNGHLVLDLKTIQRRYLRTLFIPNFVSVLPFTIAFYIVGTAYLNADGEVDSAVESFLTFIQLASLLKLIRLTRVRTIVSRSDTVRNFRQKRNSQALELWKYVWLIVIASHWFACIWCFVAFIEADGVAAEKLLGTPNWIASWYDSNGVDGGLYPLGWGQAIDRYVLSLFWAIQTITSIGYGNIVPVTRAEYFTACGIQLCAGVMWAYVIGGLVGVASGMNVRAEAYRTRIDQANELIGEFEDPDEINEADDELGIQSNQVANHIRNYIHKQYTISKGEACINTIPEFYPVFETLTPELQKASSVLLVNRYLKVVPYLSSMYMSSHDQSIVAMECIDLEFASGETIDIQSPVEGLGRGVYIFRSGCAFAKNEIEHDESKVEFSKISLVTAGMCYGEGKVLLEDDNKAAQGMLKFLTFSQVVFIPREAVLDALKKSQKAWKDCARWIYLRALFLAKLEEEKNNS